MKKANLLAVLAILPLILVSAYQRPDQTVVNDPSPQAAATVFRWTKDATNPVLAGRSSPGFDLVVADPAVIQENDGSFKMWYTAVGNPNGRPRIGLATSSNGRTWTRRNAPVLDLGPAGSFDAYALETAWVLKDSADPSTPYHMYYCGYDSVNAQGLPQNGQIGLAKSSDGITWTKSPQNPIMTIDKSYQTNLWSSFGLWGPVVIKDDDDGLYKMWYLGVGPDSADWRYMMWGIGYATSTDGVNWTRNPGPVLYSGPGRPFQRYSDISVSVLKIGVKFYLWFTGNKQDNDNYEIWQASSIDGIAWNVDSQASVLSRGRPGTWDSFCVMAPSVLRVGNQLWMWYHGDRVADPYYLKIGLAKAPVPTP